MCFRIYRLEGFQVRTTREHNCEEVVGAVFSSCEESSAVCREQAEQDERIMRVVEYVERVQGSEGPVPDRHYYIVLETESGHRIVTERQRDGTIAWAENPKGLEARNALAKVINSAESCKVMSVGDLKAADQTRSFFATGSERK